MNQAPVGKPDSHRSELEFRRLLEKLPAGAYTCDTRGLITYFNQHAVDLWGRAPKLNDPVDRFCGSFRLFAADGSPITHDQCWMALALQTEHEYNGHEIIVERPDGNRLTVLAHANPLRDDSGRLIGAVNVLVDISDRKRAEVAIRASEERFRQVAIEKASLLQKLKDSDRRKDEFLAILAHELRNPLAPVLSAAHVLRIKGPPVREVQWAADVIERQVQQMTRLVDDLLDLSRIALDKIDLRQEEVPLMAVVNNAVEASRPLIEQRGHELTITLPPQPIHLEADITRLSQVLLNLLNNAAKYTEQGGKIWLTARRDGEHVEIRVRDTGIGIRPEMLACIFDPFTQADRSLERSQSGLGIGLTLARRLVEMHDGTIDARSEGPGMGSEFVVRLPVSPGTRRRLEASAGDGVNAIAPRKCRILVVDDNQDAAESLGLWLGIMGNEVRMAHDGLEAVGAAAAFRPEVVFLDIGLPKLNGYEAAGRIRELEGGDGMVLIALTGWGQEEDRRRSKQAGFDGHLTKPVEIAVLQALLAEATRGRAQGR